MGHTRGTPMVRSHAQVPQHRPIRKPGTAAPTAGTKARVMVLTEDVAAEADAGAIPADWDIATPR